MVLQRLKKLTAYILILSMMGSFMPSLAFAQDEVPKEKVKTLDELTKEDVVEKTEDSTTYDLGKGQKMTVLYGGEVRYKDDKGKLKDYDASLVKINEGEKTEHKRELKGYSLRNNKGDTMQYLPSRLSEETPLVMESDEYSIQVTMSDETIRMLDVTSDILVKEEKLPDIYDEVAERKVNAKYESKDKKASVTYTSGEHGVKEEIVLFKEPESNVIEYVLNIGDLKAKKNPESEAITIYDEEKEELVAGISKAWMNDATEKAYSEEIKYELKEDENVKGRYVLRMILDEEYLHSKDRKYPITIDPEITWLGSSMVKDVYVISGKYQNTNFFSSGTTVMPAGNNSTGTHLTYIKFVNLKNNVNEKIITDATFSAYEVSGSADNQQVSIYRVGSSWSESSLTYNNRPALTGNALSTITTKPTTVEHKFNVLSYVQGVANGTYQDYGVALKNTSSSPSYAGFVGSRSSSSTYRPKLKVTYSDAPIIPTTATSASLAPRYVNDSSKAKLTFSGITATNLMRTEYRVARYNEDTETEGDTVIPYGEATAIVSGGSLKSIDEGCYRVYVRGVNSEGTEGGEKSAGELHVDKTEPSFEKASIKDSSGKDLNGGVTSENDPIISFNGVTDRHIDNACIKYALMPKDEVPTASDFKTPNNLNISSTSPYSGSFRLTDADKAVPVGEYEIHVRAIDLAGNTKTKKLRYIKDNKAPSGSIKIKDPRTGVEISNLSEPAELEVRVDGTGSEIKEGSLKLYKLKKDSGENDVIDEATEINISKELGISENIIFDTLDICDSYGKYRLVLHLVDEAGLSFDTTKDFDVVYVLPSPDKAEIKASRGGTTSFSYEFPYTHNQKIKLSKIEAKFDNETSFHEIVSAADGEYLPFSGEVNIEVPEAEGEHTVVIRGVSQYGHSGTEYQTKCVVDRTNPVANMTLFDQGFLKGSVTDTNFKEWKIYAKPSGQEEYFEEPVASGTHEINQYWIAFLDLTQEAFTHGSSYTLKLVAQDKAGNEGIATYDIVIPTEQSLMPKIVEPEILIERGRDNLHYGGFVVGTNTQRLEITNGVTGADWYINNRKANNEIYTLPEDILFKDWWNDVLAIKKEEDGSRKYSTRIVLNGSKQEVALSGTSGESYIFSQEGVLAFRITATPGVATYKIKPELGGNETFKEVEVGKTYYITDITGGANAFSSMFVVQATANPGKNLSDANLVVHCDTLVNDMFMYSDVENYAPKNLSVAGKINYKTYLKWDVPYELPDNVCYRVYRGTSEDFIANDETLVADNLKTGSYLEINTVHGKDFYYKVCAVKKYDEMGMPTDVQSTFSEVIATRTTDSNEFVKRIGIKEYWDFAEFDTPCGNGYIEKSKGNFVYKQMDAELSNEGAEVSLDRVYNSASSSKGMFGTGWSHEYDMELQNICENNSLDFLHVVLKDGNGTIYHFTRDSGETEFVSSLGSYVNLSAEETEQTKTVYVLGQGDQSENKIKYQFTLSTKDGDMYYFNSQGQLVLYMDVSDNFIIFSHNDKGMLSKMTTKQNVSIEFLYNDESTKGDPLTVREVKLPDGSKLNYEYQRPAFSSDVLLKKVTEVSGSESVSYEYDYDKSLLGSEQRNLTKIKDATGANTYKIDYDYEADKVESAVYPNGEKLSFKYSDDDSNTITSKYSGGEVVSCEKNYFDRVSGKVEKSIEADDAASLTEDNPDAEITTYTYQNNKLVKMESSNEYYQVGEDGSISKSSGTKVNSVEYNGDDPSKEQEDDGAITEYTYYDENDGAHLDGQVKTIKETSLEGELVTYRKYSYDANGNTIEDIDYVSKAKGIFTYYQEGDFKGELQSEKEYLLTVSDSYEVTGEVLQSTSVFTYEYTGEGEGKQKIEACTQTLPKPDGSNEVIQTQKIYDVTGRLIKETDSRGYETSYTYDGLGRNTDAVLKYSDSENLKKSSHKAYDANGMVTYEKTEEGIENWYTYDNMQRVISVRSKKGDLDEVVNTSYRYEDVDVYCGKGSSTVHVDKAYVSRTEYQDGTLISEVYTDNDGNVVRSYQNGRYTDMTYTKAGDLLSKWSMGKTLSGVNGVLSLYIYDNRGDLTEVITDAGYESGVGNTGYKLTDDSIVTKNTYDSEGNVISSTDPLGHKTEYTYDKEGNITSLLTASNAKYEYRYDVKGDNNTTRDIVISPREVGVSEGRVSSKSIVVKDVSGKTVEVADLGTMEADDTAIRTKYEYDIRDNLSKSIEGNGNYKLYSYDARDRVTKISAYENTGGEAKHTLSCTYTYDDSDNVLSMTDYEVTDSGEEVIYHYTAYSYDGFNRLVSVSEHNTNVVPTEEEIEAKKVTYVYNGKDQLVSIDYPSCVSEKISGLKFEYDSLGYLSKIWAVPKAGNDKLLRSYTYTDKYQIDEISEYKDFDNVGASPLKRKYTYDKLGRVTGIEYYVGIGSEPKEAFYYEYDKCNNITRERSISTYSASNGVSYEVEKNHSYNEDGRLVSTDVTEKNESGTVTKESSVTYSYDVAGNMLTEESTSGGSIEESNVLSYNEFNQLTKLVSKDSADTVTSNKDYTYDNSGNRVSENDTVTGKVVTQSYDAENRLKKVEGRTGDTVEYTQINRYNGSGQRIEKKEGTNTTNYYYDGTKVLYTDNENDEVTSFNMIGLNGNIISTERKEGELSKYYSYIVDIRGSTTNLVGEDGTSKVSYEYDDYGDTVIHNKDENDPIFNEVCYTGGIYDETTGLYNLNARYYDTESNSFLSQDTYRGERNNPNSLNLYSYCEGDPITYIDPSGHWVSSVIFGALGAYDGYKYAKKKNLKGAKKAAAVVGGAILGAVNPFKVVKSAKTGYKAYKVAKVTKVASTAKKTTTVAKALTKKSKTVSAVTKVVKKVAKPKTVKSAKTVAKKAAKKGPGCFVKGTKVHTNGGFKAIEKIRVGDHVWSENPETNEKALKKVKKIFVREKDSIIRLSINGEVIKTTDEHPFYKEGVGFVPAKSLEVGDRVRLEGNESGIVESTETIHLDKPIKVYNFEVEDYHTYYVSEAKVLVHNTCAVTKKNIPDVNGVDLQGYANFNQLKKAMGSAGEGNAWHHIVEQSLIKKSGFSAEQIHNPENVIAIPHGKGSVHAKISGLELSRKVQSVKPTKFLTV